MATNLQQVTFFLPERGQFKIAPASLRAHLVSTGESHIVGKLLGHTPPLDDGALRDTANRFGARVKLPDWKM